VDEKEDGDHRNRHVITCAGFDHATARMLVAGGDIEGARERAKIPGKLWPPLRQEMLADPTPTPGQIR